MIGKHGGLFAKSFFKGGGTEDRRGYKSPGCFQRLVKREKTLGRGENHESVKEE